MNSWTISCLCQDCFTSQTATMENCLSPVICIVVAVSGILNIFSSADYSQMSGLTRNMMPLKIHGIKFRTLDKLNVFRGSSTAPGYVSFHKGTA